MWEDNLKAADYFIESLVFLPPSPRLSCVALVPGYHTHHTPHASAALPSIDSLFLIVDSYFHLNADGLGGSV